MRIRKAILPIGPLIMLFVFTAVLIGAEKLAGYIIDSYTTVDPKVACVGKSLEPGDELMDLNLVCGDKKEKAYTRKAKVIARYVAKPSTPIICKRRKSGDIACDE